MPVLLVAVTLFSGSLVSMMKQRAVNREAAAAAYDIQSLFERMRNEDLEDVYALYNANPMDDPGGPGTAPGNTFAVFGLESPQGPDVPVGRVLLPEVDTAAFGDPPAWQLREDLQDGDLGLPRDLNRDHVVDDQDHALDYAMLPVVARVQWVGEFGVRELEMYTLLTHYRSGDE